MKKTNKKNAIEKTTTLDGMMTFGKLDDGLNALDFSSFEAVEMEPFTATCKVQAMRDGNVYITEKPKRVRNKPLFREDNSSLTLGRDGNYYFVFKLSEELLEALPDRLVQQSLAIAQKVQRGIIGGKEATE
jgi:hypothetical protein